MGKAAANDIPPLSFFCRWVFFLRASLIQKPSKMED
jgi:hypothetical protein